MKKLARALNPSRSSNQRVIFEGTYLVANRLQDAAGCGRVFPYDRFSDLNEVSDCSAGPANPHQ